MGICGSKAQVSSTARVHAATADVLAVSTSLTRGQQVSIITAGKGLSDDELGYINALPRYMIEKLFLLKDRLTKENLVRIGKLQAVVGGAESERVRRQATEFRNYLRDLTAPRFIVALRVWQATDKQLKLEEAKLDYLHGLTAEQFAAAMSLIKQTAELSVEFFTALFADLPTAQINKIQPQSLKYLVGIFVERRDEFNQALFVLKEANGHFALQQDDLQQLAGLPRARLDARLVSLKFIAARAQREFANSWQLRPATLDFLNEVITAGGDHFAKLAAEIKKICDSDKLMMSALNLDDIAAGLVMQRDLKHRLTLERLNTLGSKPAGDDSTVAAVIIRRLASIRIRKQRRLQDTIAKSQESHEFKLLMHHSLAHAAEVAHRTILLCEKRIPGFKENAFLKAIVGFLAEFHDFEQQLGNPFIGLSSNEQLTVKAIQEWLMEERLGLYPALNPYLSTDEVNLLKDFIDYLAHREIIIGTTMVFGSFGGGEFNVDAANLFRRLENVLVGVESLSISDVRANTFFQTAQAVTLILGESDKNPAAHPDIVAEQQRETSVFASLQTAFEVEVDPIVEAAAAAGSRAATPDGLLLNRFFNSDRFSPYFEIPAAASAGSGAGSIVHSDRMAVLNIEAFLIALAANMGMVMELTDRFFAPTDSPAVKLEKRNMARRLAEFVIACRALDKCESEEGPVIYSLDDDGKVIIDLANFEKCLTYYPDILEIVRKLFIEKIPVEQAFARKQARGVAEAEADLSEVLPLALEDVDGDELAATSLELPFSCPGAMTAHANNLGALKEFYESLDPDSQQRLLKELLLSVIFQAGHGYVIRMQLGQEVPYFPAKDESLPRVLAEVSELSYPSEELGVHADTQPASSRAGQAASAPLARDRDDASPVLLISGQGSSYFQSPEQRRRTFDGQSAAEKSGVARAGSGTLFASPQYPLRSARLERGRPRSVVAALAAADGSSAGAETLPPHMVLGRAGGVAGKS